MQAAPKWGDFVRPNALQQSMVMVAFDITCDCAKNLKQNVSQTREQHSLKALITFNHISKSNHNDNYREYNRKIQRKIRHYTNPPQLRETNIVFFLLCDQPSIRSVALSVRRQSEDCCGLALDRPLWNTTRKCSLELPPPLITCLWDVYLI